LVSGGVACWKEIWAGSIFYSPSRSEDTDMIVVKPFDSLPQNTAGYEDASENRLNNAFLRFQEPNSSLFLQYCLEEILTNFQNEPWGVNGPFLLTRVYQQNSSNTTGVQTVSHTHFQYFPYSKVAQLCMKADGKRMHLHLKEIRELSYTVHLNNHRTRKETRESGSVCDCLYRTFCLSNLDCGKIDKCQMLFDDQVE
jgi:Alpha 1,4-glycosyltransferase conserved region